MGLENLKTAIWISTGAGLAFLSGSAYLKWQWPNASFLNHWSVASLLGTTGVVAATVGNKLIDPNSEPSL